MRLGVAEEGGDVVVREEGVREDLGRREAGAVSAGQIEFGEGTAYGSESIPSQE